MRKESSASKDAYRIIEMGEFSVSRKRRRVYLRFVLWFGAGSVISEGSQYSDWENDRKKKICTSNFPSALPAQCHVVRGE